MKEITCCFIGHRDVFNENEVSCKVAKEITRLIGVGVKRFLVGTHGRFDSICLDECKKAQKLYPHIEIAVVMTSFGMFGKTENAKILAEYYRNENTMFYPIEEVYFKRKITISNRMMIDDSDYIVAYVREFQHYGGAISAYRYAKRKGKNIVNLYQEPYK